MSRCIGQQGNLAASLAKSREGILKKYAHNDPKRKDDGLVLMNRVHANGHLVTLLERLPVNAVGNTKPQKVLAMNLPCTLLFSIQSYVNCIRSPSTAIASLLLDTELDDEGKDIVRAMLKMRSENIAASDAKYK